MLPGLRRVTGENYCDNLSSVSILREGGKTQEIAHSLILSSWILLSFILKLRKTFSISE